jgi:hypothetical protein
MTNLFASSVSAVTRLACLGFVVVAGMTIPQAWDILNETSFSKEGNTVYVPIELCSASSIAIEYSQLNFTRESTNDGCHTLQYFINACVASMFFSGAAILIFILWDALSKYCAGPVARFSTTMGMSLFLTFILFQTAAVNYALYKECNYWTDYYMDRFKEAGTSSISDVQTYGDPFFFFLTCVMALSCSGLLLLDALVGFFFSRATKPTKDDAIDVRSTDSTHLNSNTSSTPGVMAVDPVEDPPQEQPMDPKRWTSY